MYAGIVDWPWWGYVAVTLAMTHVTIIAVTIFLHRHQAHRALDLHPLPAHFFRLWLWLTTGMGTREWTSIHRKHHARCETSDDPHSPQIYGINRVLWGGVFLYVKEARNAETQVRYGHGTPDDWIERKLYTPCQKLGVAIMLGINVGLFGIVAGGLIWAIQVAWIPFWAAGVINGLGHFWGYRNFNSPDASKNILPIGILIGGEELHNNHHTFATSAKLSSKWYEFDLGWLYIRLLAMCGLAQVKRLAPVAKVGRLRPVVDSETVQAVIANRYDVLAGFARSLRRMYRAELNQAPNRRQISGLKRCLSARASSVPAALRGRLELLLRQSNTLRTAYAMREDLAALWERSNASREQLIRELQEWCRRAEASGIRQLQELSLRMRSYSLN